MSSCPICISKYNATTHRCINCANCHHSACRSCIQRYIMECLEKGDSSLQCMSCHHVKSVDWLYSIASKTWIESNYAEAKKRMIWKLEQQNLIRDAQPFLKQSKTIEDLRLQILQADKELAEFQKISAEREKLFTTMSVKVENLMRLKHELEMVDSIGDVAQVSSDGRLSAAKPLGTSDILGRCDQTPGCLGLLEGRTDLTAQCILCDIKVCVRCFKRKLDQHECVEEDVSNAATLLHGTRLCPCCFVRIFKVDGCDLMFCFKCGKGFDWSTLTRVADVENHPELDRFLDEKREELDDTQLPCFGDLTASELMDWDRLREDWQFPVLPKFSLCDSPNTDLILIQCHHEMYDQIEERMLREKAIVDAYLQNTKRTRMRFALEHGPLLDNREENQDKSISDYTSHLWNLELSYNLAAPLYDIFNLHLNQLRRILLYVHREFRKFKSPRPSFTWVKKWTKTDNVQSKIRELEELTTMTNEALAQYAKTYHMPKWQLDIQNSKLIRGVQSKSSSSGITTTRKRKR